MSYSDYVCRISNFDIALSCRRICYKQLAVYMCTATGTTHLNQKLTYFLISKLTRSKLYIYTKEVLVVLVLVLRNWGQSPPPLLSGPLYRSTYLTYIQDIHIFVGFTQAGVDTNIVDQQSTSIAVTDLHCLILEPCHQ